MKYNDAIQNALALAMRTNPRVFVMGMGVADPKGVFGSTLGLVNEFGAERVFDIPLSENAIVGVAIGAAMQDMRLVNQRIDFLWLALDQIANHAAKWRRMFNGAQTVPIIIRAIVGRGWGQGGQHSQSLHATFAHVPGLIVIAPATPYDVKGMLLNAMQGDDPVICIEHRWLYEEDGPVPDGAYTVPFGKAAILREGMDITIVATSQMVIEAKKAVKARRDYWQQFLHRGAKSIHQCFQNAGIVSIHSVVKLSPAHRHREFQSRHQYIQQYVERRWKSRRRRLQWGHQ